MVDLPVLDFTVKSSVHDYKVKFIEDARNVLKNEIRDGDVIIIVNKVTNNKVNPFIVKETEERVKIIRVEFKEHGKNSAIYEPEQSY